jgi:Rha family phage regulatory protein
MKFKSVKGIDSVMLSTKNNPVTTAKIIADHFGKRKSNVMRDIKNIEKDVPEFAAQHFAIIKTEQKAGAVTRKVPEYIMDETGFMFLVMGFTGKKAAEMKVAFINQFKAMKEYIEKQNAPRYLESSIQDDFIIAASLSSKPFQQEVWYNGDDDIRFDMVEKTTRSYVVYELKKDQLTQDHVFKKIENKYPEGIKDLGGRRKKRFIFVAPSISQNAKILLNVLNEGDSDLSYDFFTIEELTKLIKSRIPKGYKWFYDGRFESLTGLNDALTKQKNIENGKEFKKRVGIR